MKKTCKITLIMLLINFILLMNNIKIFAVDVQGTDGSSVSSSSSTDGSSSSSSSLGFSSIIQSGKNFISKGRSTKTIDQKTVEKDLMPLAQIVMGFAILVLLVVGAILGVKYMISGADEKAKIKEKLIWYVVSAVLIFGAVSIFNIVVSILNNATD